MALTYNLLGTGADPLDYLSRHSDESVMAVITGVEGPSYRPVGAIMAIGAKGERVGSLSSGCIEGDLAEHGLKALKKGTPVHLRYGRGSPFMDIQLPCGGGLDIMLVPQPDRAAVNLVREHREARRPCVLLVNRQMGAMEVVAETTSDPELFCVSFQPDIRFLVFGKGPEAITFTALVHSIGYPAVLLSPDSETRDAAVASGCEAMPLKRGEFPSDIGIDRWSAVIAFFHDHEWEPPILGPALDSPAFYVGAQGSRRSAMARLLELEEMGISPDTLSRLRGPVGLVPSARDARTLSVSVLAEVLDVARGSKVAT